MLNWVKIGLTFYAESYCYNEITARDFDDGMLDDYVWVPFIFLP